MALTIDELNIQIAANSSSATRALTSLIKKLEKLQTTLGGTNASNIIISNSFNKTTNSVNKTTNATNKYDNATKKSSKSTKSLSDKLYGAISKWRTLFGAFKSAANIMGGLYNESNKYVETLNLFNVTMGDGAEAAYKYAESVQKLVGIDIEEWMGYQGTFKQLTAGFGVADDAANTMSQNLTQLSYDLSSFFNTDVETAFDKLSSAMSGQVKGLRQFGIDTSVASLQEYALAKGIEKSVRSMTQAEKSLLRYNYIMEKSVIIQGDMARTIVTPANALRILNAQLTQMKRALGNVVSVLVTQYIPWVQAFVRVITDAANALASFFGFELPTIDYSSLDAGAFAEDLEEAAESAKEIKKQLMGFDELNIISNPDTDSGVGDALSGMRPIEYDFLKDLDTSVADEIYDKLKKMLSPMKKVGDYIVDYADTLKTIGGIILGFGLINKIKKLVTSLAKLKIISDFITYFKVLRLEGNGLFKSITGGIGGVRDGLTGIQKAAIVATAAIIEFVAVKDSVRELALGCEDVGAKIATIGVTAGTAAVAMYAALGPAGLAFAALVGLMGAIAGVQEANQIMMSEMVSEAFYDGVGIKITDLATDFETLMTKIVNTNQPILDNKETIDKAAGSIDNAKGSIDNLIISYDRGIISTDEFAKGMQTKFDSLKDNVKITMDAIYDNVIYALSTSLGDAIEQANGSVEEYLRIIGKIKSDGDTLYSSLIQKQEQLSISFMNGDITATEYADGLRDVNEKMSVLSGATSTVTTFSDKIEGLKNTVNWESESARNNAFETINSSATDAKAAVNQSCDEIKRNLETMKLWTTDQEAIVALDELLLGNEKSRETQLAEIDTAINTMYDTLQESVVNKISSVAEAAATEWGAMTKWERVKSGFGSEAAFVEDALSTYRDDIVTPISSGIEASIEQLGTDGAVWMVDAVNEMVIGGFAWGVHSGGISYVRGYSEKLGEYAKAALTESGKDASTGFKNGVLQTIDGVTGAFEKMVTDSIDTVQETQDSHSPSKEFWKLGLYAILGYANAVSDNFSKIENVFIDNFKKIFDEISSLAKKSFSESAWSGYANSITKALSNIKIPSFKNIGLSVSFDTLVSSDKKKVYEALGLSGWPNLNWYTYAQGGFPTVGEMFIARERGPELVGSIGRKTAVANNDQIVSGIEAGVYRAMMAANAGNGGGSQTIRIINEIDGDVVGEKVIQYHNNRVIQTGFSPLLA